MESIGYKWYLFKIYFDEGKIEIYDDKKSEILKTIKFNFDSKLEKIIKNRSKEMIDFFDKILEKAKLS